MKLKKIIQLAVFGVIGFSLFKLFKQISQYFCLKDSLSQYLFDVTGVHPHFSSQFRTNHIKIDIGYPLNTIEQHEGLEKTVKDYVTDYYDYLAGYKIVVKVYPTDY